MLQKFFLAMILAAIPLILDANAAKATMIEKDVHSFARPDEAVVKHIALDLSVDFQKQQLSGKATLEIDNRKNVDKLYLDTRDLKIERVTLGEKEHETTWKLGDKVQFLGQPLIVDVRPETKFVHIYYSTSREAAALQWLDPAQTAGKKHPFLLTQSQAILARTWVPLQDTPGVRFTYAARIKVPKELLALMSATNPTKKNPTGVYEFKMDRPIPSYLLALAVGDIDFRPLGKRAGVYAEPSVVEKAAWEFAETEKMIAATEKLYGPYRWERYDIIVLPPSFPFGGMENPRLTFATPTLLAGDRSLVAVIAHELAHSWSGNLVTNATWDDFWLNEGFTTYIEHRIMEEVYGKQYEQMLALLSLQDLEAEVQNNKDKPADTHLKLHLKGRDPDDGMTDIAYEKGHYFLRTIENIVGRQAFDKFLRSYFDQYAFQSITTETFVSYLRENLIKGNKDLEKKIDLQAWIFGPGVPKNIVEANKQVFASVEQELEDWKSGKKKASEIQAKDWNTHQKLHFIRHLPKPMTVQQMSDLDKAFGFSQTGNSEVMFEWLHHVIENKYEPGYAALEKFLTSMGRRKFLRPLYARMAQTPEGLEMGRKIYRKARPTYHSVSVSSIDEVLKWDQVKG